jgi:GNAT superfamily N-acetyltransferase
MILKFFKRIKSDGISNVIKIVINKLVGFFFRNIITYGFEFDLTNTANHDDEPIKVQKLAEAKKILHLSKSEVNKALLNDGECYIVKNGGEVSGYSFVSFGVKNIVGFDNIQLKNNNLAWIGPVFVSKKYRGLGINKVMVNFAIKTCRQKGIKSLLTSINSKNIPSINSFIKIGFKKTIAVHSLMIFGFRFEIKRETYV